MFIVFLIVCVLAIFGFICLITNPSEEVFAFSFVFILLSVGSWFLYRYEIVDAESSVSNVCQVERRLDGTTYVYATNSFTGELVGIRLVGGLELLTDEQLLTKIEVEHSQSTARNGSISNNDKLKY